MSKEWEEVWRRLRKESKKCWVLVFAVILLLALPTQDKAHAQTLEEQVMEVVDNWASNGMMLMLERS